MKSSNISYSGVENYEYFISIFLGRKFALRLSFLNEINDVSELIEPLQKVNSLLDFGTEKIETVFSKFPFAHIKDVHRRQKLTTDFFRLFELTIWL